jgi:hypothetical protein
MDYRDPPAAIIDGEENLIAVLSASQSVNW